MKKVIYLFILLILFGSCSHVRNLSKVDDGKSPVWTTEIPSSDGYLYGVGFSEFELEDERLYGMSDMLAMTDLAKNIESIINQTVNTLYLSVPLSEVGENKVRAITSDIIDETLCLVEIKKHWQSPEGVCWTLVSIEKDKIKEIIAMKINAYRKVLDGRILELENLLEHLVEDIHRVEKLSINGNIAELSAKDLLVYNNIETLKDVMVVKLEQQILDLGGILDLNYEDIIALMDI